MAGKSVLGSLVQMASITVTQGSADAFATAELQTGISTASRYGWLIDRVEFQIQAGVTAFPVTADGDYEIQLVQGSVPTALLAFTDANLVANNKRGFVGTAAAAVAYTFDLKDMWMAPENLVIVDPSVHIAIDSANSGVALVGSLRIYYYPVELSELDILRMIALR
jgi:hypothetical protein